MQLCKKCLLYHTMFSITQPCDHPNPCPPLTHHYTHIPFPPHPHFFSPANRTGRTPCLWSHLMPTPICILHPAARWLPIFHYPKHFNRWTKLQWTMQIHQLTNITVHKSCKDYDVSVKTLYYHIHGQPTEGWWGSSTCLTHICLITVLAFAYNYNS